MENKTYQHLITSYYSDLVSVEILRLHHPQLQTPLLDGSAHHSEVKNNFRLIYNPPFITLS